MSFSSTPSDEPPTDLPNDANLMKTILPPLLEDFQHWFARTLEMMATRDVSFLTAEQQQNLLGRVQLAQKQVSASQVLSSATDSQAGIEMPVVMAWHKLVHECWGVSLRSRQEEKAKRELNKAERKAEQTQNETARNEIIREE